MPQYFGQQQRVLQAFLYRQLVELAGVAQQLGDIADGVALLEGALEQTHLQGGVEVNRDIDDKLFILCWNICASV